MNFLPIEEGVVEVFAEALQNPVVVPDGGSLILTGRKVTLQLREAETNTVILLCEKGNINSIPRKKFLPYRLDSNNERKKEEEEFAVKWKRFLVSNVAFGGMQNLQLFICLKISKPRVKRSGWVEDLSNWKIKLFSFFSLNLINLKWDKSFTISTP